MDKKLRGKLRRFGIKKKKKKIILKKKKKKKKKNYLCVIYK